jgi:hypothetical protein
MPVDKRKFAQKPPKKTRNSSSRKIDAQIRARKNYDLFRKQGGKLNFTQKKDCGRWPAMFD